MQRGISGNDRHPADWERQREQLSAYLDGELEPDEHATLERHLTDCPACQEELRQLRATRALLRAMPVPALPRSFTLPEEGPVPVPLPRRAAAPPRRVARRGPRIAQWGGALAAALGLALLLGSALAAGHGTTSLASAPYSGSGAQADQTTSRSPSATSTGPYSINSPAVGTGAATQPAKTPKAATPGQQTPTPTPTFAPSGRNTNPTNSVNTVPPALPITGAGLFVGGAVVFVVGRVTRGRRSAA
jgi:hypothetical protein